MALKRDVGLLGAAATAVGIVVSSSALMMMGSGFGMGGKGFIISMIIAATINLLVAFSFSELTSMMPLSGGINHYTLPAMGPAVGIFAVLCGYFMVSVMSNAAESSIAGQVLSDVLLPMFGLSGTAWAVILMVILTLVNIRGIKSFAVTQVILAGVMIISMLALSTIGLLGLGTGEPLPSSFTSTQVATGGVITMLGTAFWLFVGLEFVCPLAEEIKNPKVFIPLSMILGLIIIFISDTLFGLLALKYVPMADLAASDIPHVDTAMAVLGRGGQIWIGIISLFATGSTLNTFVAAVPRMMYGMAKEGQFPKVFAKVNRWGSPFIGILFIFVITIALLFIPNAGDLISTLILSGSIGWMIAYLIAHADVIILRRKYPEVERSFKVPFGPLLPILSSIGLITMIIKISPDPVARQGIFLFAGIAVAICALWSIFWVKVVMKKGLFEVTPMEDILETARQTMEESELAEE